MTQAAETFAKAAEDLINTPFRLHGRSRETGLDCVGLVEHALRCAGKPSHPIPTYSLRNADYRFVPDLAAKFELVPAQQPIIRGDLLTVRPGVAQLHLIVAVSANEFVHAHAGLRRVVLMPSPMCWPVIHLFRFNEKD